ncbi:MAG TPA: Gfo/Idh/MocA family oxidoreductase [bacterium]|nr:Gfo/Idh/MocA family oxidoreductase [bacterium]
MNNVMNRRQFLATMVGGMVVSTALGAGRVFGANDRIRVGMMGIGGRGTYLTARLAARSDVDIVYLCDVNARQFGRAAEEVRSRTNTRPQMVQDYRKMLDDQTIQGIVNATPDHWHALGTIRACQAGKDVYVEKPLSLTLWEGRQMVDAARKYERVVQAGIQNRSAPYFMEALEFLQSGQLGDIHLIRVFNMMKHSPSPRGSEEPVPNGFDWDMWCGPSEKAPYSPGRWWFNRWEYSVGGILGDQIHQLDAARALINRVAPKSVYHAGGVHYFDDGREIPDTQLVTYEFGDNLTMVAESTLWTSYMQKTPSTIRDTDSFPDWPFNSTKVEICGSEGFMYFGRHGGGWQIYNNDKELITSTYGRQSTDEHLTDWLECIRTREQPRGDVAEAHYSTALGHLANASYRAGNVKLEYNPETEQTDNSEANQHLTKEYRKPWIVPEIS